MRIFADIGSHDPAGSSNPRIIKSDSTPPTNMNLKTNVNGQFIFQIPEGSAFIPEANSYFFPQNSNSISGKTAQEFLVRYPMYDRILYNFFLETSDLTIDGITGTAPIPVSGNTTPSYTNVTLPNSSGSGTSRVYVGRGASIPGPQGMVPNKLRLPRKTFDRAGSNIAGGFVSSMIDITSLNPSNPGTDEVMVWWKVCKFETTQDVARGLAATPSAATLNTPAENNLIDVSQEPNDLVVFVSNDDGVSWYQTPRLEPVDLVTAGVNLRICFLNKGDDPLYLLGYCMLFPDLP